MSGKIIVAVDGEAQANLAKTTFPILPIVSGNYQSIGHFWLACSSASVYRGLDLAASWADPTIVRWRELDLGRATLAQLTMNGKGYYAAELPLQGVLGPASYPGTRITPYVPSWTQGLSYATNVVVPANVSVPGGVQTAAAYWWDATLGGSPKTAVPIFVDSLYDTVLPAIAFPQNANTVLTTAPVAGQFWVTALTGFLAAYNQNITVQFATNLNATGASPNFTQAYFVLAVTNGLAVPTYVTGVDCFVNNAFLASHVVRALLIGPLTLAGGWVTFSIQLGNIVNADGTLQAPGDQLVIGVFNQLVTPAGAAISVPQTTLTAGAGGQFRRTNQTFVGAQGGIS